METLFQPPKTDTQKFCDGPRGELFGRFQRPGWDVWGNEPEKFNAAALAAGADLGIASAK